MQNIPVNLLSDDPATQVICIANSTVWTLMTLHGYLPTTPLMSPSGQVKEGRQELMQPHDCLPTFTGFSLSDHRRPLALKEITLTPD